MGGRLGRCHSGVYCGRFASLRCDDGGVRGVALGGKGGRAVLARRDGKTRGEVETELEGGGGVPMRVHAARYR